MPDIEVDCDSARETEDSVVKVEAGNLSGPPATWYLDPGDTIEIRDDSPNWVRIETIDDN